MESNEQDKGVMELATAFKKFIPLLAGMKSNNTRFFTAEVIEAPDEDNRTCKVRGVLDGSEMEYSGVNLSMERNDGVIEVPAVDSTVLVCRTPDGELYVIKCSDISKWIVYIDNQNSFVFDSSGFILNGGLYGGFVKVGELVIKINALENLVNSILTALKTTTIPLAPSGTYPFAPLYAALNVIAPITTEFDLENTAAKH